MAKIERNREKTVDGFPYWIIINKKRESIWQGARASPIFSSEAEALKEFNFQVAALKPGKKHGFEIEMIDGPRSSIVMKEESKQLEMESFERVAQGLPYKEPD